METTFSTSGMPVAEAAALFPRRNGKKIHVRTIKRWIIQGARGVKLHGWRVGGVWFTSAEAVSQFQTACTSVDQPTSDERSPAQQERAVKQARERLRENGFYGKQSAASSA